MTLDPREVVDEVAEQTHAARLPDAPRLLSRSPEIRAPIPPAQASEEVSELHRAWAEIHSPHGAPDASVGTKILNRVMGPALVRSRGAQHEDRTLIGDLIRAVDALAARSDELARRVADLEALVKEVVELASEDLVRILARLEAGAVNPPAP